MIRFAVLALPFALAACAGVSGMPVEDDDLPPVQRSENWKDWGREENVARRVSGTPLGTEALKARLVGNVLSGCYPNEQTFSERLTTDGNVIEAGTGKQLAKYAIQSDQLCFQYPNQPVACYTVTEDRDRLLFYSAGGFRLVAATGCPFPKDVKGVAESPSSSG
ncbi:hypothetical protein HK107_10910 [Parvularcula sp. ZS-1/3]|uniref:Lipoprotein n=1 Tax=Parvularcula mediterranea TaxID=2732508 RepID=A0A7Y3RMH5_9PROT|nr:hypothetical protein [Parvularcula mediterranea]NNU16828.1 hypothetical protein [Parvularcula mediterranea]